MEPYTPGEQPGERKYVKLNTNESPFPPSKKAQELAKEQAAKLMLYPDPECKELTWLVEKRCGVKEGQVLLTNGSDEMLNFAFAAYCDEDRPAVFANITYGFYKVFADVNGVPYEEIPLTDGFEIALEDYAGKQGVIFIANPNAPTGIALSVEKIEKLIQDNPDRIVVVDEAYVDFGGESCVPLVKKYDNVLVTQTFSKSRSMAGARLGFGIASEGIISDLMRIKYSTNPYNVNRMTAAAGLGAILDHEYFYNNCQKIIENREYLKKELNGLGFQMTDSKANFLFVKSNRISGEELYSQLKERGILVRHFTGERIKEYNRITIGSKEEMQALVETIKIILGEQK